MDKQQCNQCKEFMQHYAFSKGKLFRVYCGHCRLPGARRKRPDAHACDKFVPGTADTEEFVTKEYLSKELLAYILRLELLPEIRDLER